MARILSSEYMREFGSRVTEYGHRQRLYCASGYGLIQAIKAIMSYEDEVCFVF